MKIAVILFLAFTFISCNEKKESTEKNKIESLIENAEKQLNAESSTMVERDENVKEQGFKKVLNIDFIGCKSIDLMDRSLKEMTKLLALELKNNMPGSEKIDMYKIRLLKDPNDTTPSKSGFNIQEKGFTYYREDLN